MSLPNKKQNSAEQRSRAIADWRFCQFAATFFKSTGNRRLQQMGES
jgi:hypothetical protein